MKMAAGKLTRANSQMHAALSPMKTTLAACLTPRLRPDATAKVRRAFKTADIGGGGMIAHWQPRIIAHHFWV
jgi:hypothetical protein